MAETQQMPVHSTSLSIYICANATIPTLKSMNSLYEETKKEKQNCKKSNFSEKKMLNDLEL